MSILSGFFKTIKYRMTDQGYKWQSEKTSSQTVVMGDGTDNTDTAEKRFGAIKGLTSSTSVTDTGYALDATIGKKHEDSIAALNQSLVVKQESLTSRNGTSVPGFEPYAKRQNNDIKLTGAINGQINQVLYIIPNEYRPSKKQCFMCPSLYGTQSSHFAIIIIEPTGEISFSYAGGQNISLDGIS